MRQTTDDCLLLGKQCLASRACPSSSPCSASSSSGRKFPLFPCSRHFHRFNFSQPPPCQAAVTFSRPPLARPSPPSPPACCSPASPLARVASSPAPTVTAPRARAPCAPWRSPARPAVRACPAPCAPRATWGAAGLWRARGPTACQTAWWGHARSAAAFPSRPLPPAPPPRFSLPYLFSLPLPPRTTSSLQCSRSRKMTKCFVQNGQFTTRCPQKRARCFYLTSARPLLRALRARPARAAAPDQCSSRA